MKATLNVELEPFATPSFVFGAIKPGLRQEGWQERPRYPLSDLDPQTLDRLCDQFRAEVFRKAGKQEPPSCALG